MQKKQDLQIRLEQSVLILDKKELLTSKQAIALSRLTNADEYVELRQWLLRISVLFYDKAGFADQMDSYVLTKFGRFLKDLVGDMDGLKVIKEKELAPEPEFGQ